MYFHNIVGQGRLKAQIKELMATSSLPHAMLLVGDSGRGGLQLAMATASAILCDDQKDGEACGICTQCLKSMQYLHPDLHFAYPVVKHPTKKREDTVSADFLVEWRKFILDANYSSYPEWLLTIDAEDKQGDINTKECGEIIKSLSLKPFQSKYKVLIIWMPECLGKNGNKLLKTIEEPSENTHIIMVAESTEGILNTILSRCQTYIVPPIEKDAIRQYLGNKDLSDVDIERLCSIGEGNLQLVERFLNELDENIASEVIQWFRFCYLGSVTELQNWILDFNEKSKEEQKSFVGYCLFILREYLKHSFAKDIKSGLSGDDIKLMEGMRRVLDVQRVAEISDILSKSLIYMARNANVKILMMSVSLKIGEIMKLKKHQSTYSN